jgi:hypothetical protein
VWQCRWANSGIALRAVSGFRFRVQFKVGFGVGRCNGAPAPTFARYGTGHGGRRYMALHDGGEND